MCEEAVEWRMKMAEQNNQQKKGGQQQDATSAPVHRKKRRRPKGSGSVYKLKGVRARPYVAVTGKKEVLGTYGTPGEAVQALDAYNAQNTPAERLKCTFADAYEKWRAQPKFSSLSRDMINGYELAFKKAAPLYSRQMRDLKAEDYQQIIDQMVADGLSRSSCEKQRTLFSQLCEWAMAQDIINKNYAQLLTFPPQPERQSAPLRRTRSPGSAPTRPTSASARQHRSLWCFSIPECALMSCSPCAARTCI